MVGLARPIVHDSHKIMDYSELTERLRKTLYYGSVSKASNTLNSSLPLTRVMVEKFSETDSNLFLEKLCFEYAAELSREACLSPCSLVVALIYLERLCQSNPNFVSSIPSSKLFLISVMVASKFLNDDGEEDEVINSEWASSAKIDLSNLNQIERQFLQAIEWHLFVDENDFAEALNRIEFRIAQRESLKRGWLTYTDLDILARQKVLSDTWDVIYDLVINVSVACMTAYLASLVTFVGSAIVVSSLPWNSYSSPSSPTSLTQPLNPLYGKTSVNTSSSMQPDIGFIDPDSESDLVDSTISEFAFQYLDLNSDASLKDFTAVTLGSFSHLPKPPFPTANNTPISVVANNFTNPFLYLYLHQSYSALFEDVTPDPAITGKLTVLATSAVLTEGAAGSPVHCPVTITPSAMKNSAALAVSANETSLVIECALLKIKDFQSGLFKSPIIFLNLKSSPAQESMYPSSAT
uniref:Protein CNPPD1 n=1 Tax=Daphnia atkinsoni TaxID=342845 RepID=A0A4Y7LYW6_9CRUS|nr:EOG090X069C [Daphnia atkinsoni]